MFIMEVFTIPQHSYLYCPSNQCSLKHFLICSSDHIFILWKQIKMYERMKVDGDSYCQAPTSKSMHYKSVPYGLCTILLLNRQKFMQSCIFQSNPAGKSPLQLHLMPKRHLCMECSFKKLLYVLFILAVWSTAHICMKNNHSLKSLILAYIKNDMLAILLLPLSPDTPLNCMMSGRVLLLRSHSLISRSRWYPESRERDSLLSTSAHRSGCRSPHTHMLISTGQFPYRMWLSFRPVAGVSAAGGEVPGGQTGWSHSRYGCRHLF